MNLKKYKHIEDVIDDYISLSDEQIEIPILIQKSQEKFSQHLSSEEASNIYKLKEAEDMFKIFTQIKKHEERKIELSEEKEDVESILKEFLSTLNGGKISFERKDDNDKSKITFLFWVEDGRVMSNR